MTREIKLCAIAITLLLVTTAPIQAAPMYTVEFVFGTTGLVRGFLSFDSIEDALIRPATGLQVTSSDLGGVGEYSIVPARNAAEFFDGQLIRGDILATRIDQGKYYELTIFDLGDAIFQAFNSTSDSIPIGSTEGLVDYGIPQLVVAPPNTVPTSGTLWLLCLGWAGIWISCFRNYAATSPRVIAVS